MLIKRWIPSPFFKTRPANCPLDMIVIHHIGSKNGKLYSVDGAIEWFTNEKLHVNPKTGKVENKVSAHYIIPRGVYKKQTDMIILVKEENVAFHAGESSWKVNGISRTNINNYSIGIELEGDGNLVEYTDFQYEKLSKLLADIVKKYSINENNIVGHEDIAPDRKVDPGKLFDWKRIRESITPKVQVAVASPSILPPEHFFMGSGEEVPRSIFSKVSSLFRR